MNDVLTPPNMEAVLATMHRDVVWANGMEGGYVYGYEGLRKYWTRQCAMIDGRTEPPGFSAGADKTTDVEVHQTVRDLKGDVLSDKMIARRTIPNCEPTLSVGSPATLMSCRSVGTICRSLARPALSNLECHDEFQDGRSWLEQASHLPPTWPSRVL
jgi:hypothetical protein